MALLCEPAERSTSTLDWCMTNCALVDGKQNCSRFDCTCEEHCMGTNDTCLGTGAPQSPSHYSLPDALAATPGYTGLLIDGKPALDYSPGATHTITVVPNGAPVGGSTTPAS